MTKADIAEYIYEKVGGFTKKESAQLVDEVFDILKTQLAQNDQIKIAKFGNFNVREKNARMGRNPQTGDPMLIDKRHVVNFTVSQLLKDSMNKHRP